MPQHTRVDVLPIQEVVASASPSAWRDGLVVEQGAAQVTVALLDGGLRVLTTRATPQPGEPVAVHPVAELLAVGGVWYAARPSV
ncbi:nuclease [Cellulomonas sp. IC4_254]|uniref:nuclease n=1 Tax=Cellulomonas sp. IC4_254 TaxID=2714040 RepID=UPI001420E9F7|nr:nuclease [Cellulomonas sp. IC4_254]NHT18618.1 nuclease [Cellulomonas sp. IC4_254]